MRPGQTSFSELFTRDEQNPIFEAGRWPYPAQSVFNPGAVRLRSGERLLLVRVENPRIVVARGGDWVFGPSMDCEVMGDVPNVVFSCGTVVDEATGVLQMYYGAADTFIGVATANVSDLLDWLRSRGTARSTS